MMSSDFPAIVDPRGVGGNEKRKREKLAAKYKVGGKVTTRRGATTEALKGKRERLRAKYAVGGPVPYNGRPVAAPRDPNGFWARLQNEVKALNSSSQMPQAPDLAQRASPDTAAQQMAGLQMAQQGQPSAKVG